MPGIEVPSPSGPADTAQRLLSDLGGEWRANDSQVLGFIRHDERAVLSKAGESGAAQRALLESPSILLSSKLFRGLMFFAGRHLASRLIKKRENGAAAEKEIAAKMSRPLPPSGANKLRSPLTLGPDYAERERRKGISERPDSHGGFTVRARGQRREA